MICLLCRKKINTIIAREVRDGVADVFYCDKCELGMLESISDRSKLKKYYDGEYRKTTSQKLGSGMDPQGLFDMAKDFQNNRINFLKKYFGKNKRLLDVGCSAGMFLWHARKYVKEAVGIDYDSRSAKFASKVCGCKTYDKDIEETDLKRGYFDIICAFQTLEHVSDPADFIARYKKYLKPGGVMAIEVPNFNDPLRYLYDVPFYQKFYFHKSHLWYFTAKSLEKIMVKNGFRGEVFPLQEYNILNHMSWIFTNAPQPISLPGLRSPVLPIRDGVDLKAKKKLNDFIQKIDLEYKKKLGELGATACLFYIGKNHD